MSMKIGKLVTYGEVNAPIKLHVPLTIWSHVVTWQTKKEIFVPLEDRWPQNFALYWRMARRSPKWNHITLITWSQEVTCQIENLISSLLQGLYHQTWWWQEWWQEANHGVTWFFHYAVMWIHMKNLKCKISFSARPIVSRHGR